MTRKVPNLSLTLAAAIAAAGILGCGTQPADPGVTSQYPGATENEANLTQLATPCTFVADGGIATVNMAANEYALIAKDNNAALITGSGATLVNANPITVNGTPCSTATVTATKRINVNGSTGNETVIIDYLNGGFALGTAANPGINIDLKAGTGDVVKIRGSSGVDVAWLATLDAGTASLAGQYAVNLGVSGTAPLVGVKGMTFMNVESLVVSTGPGNDVVMTNGKPDAGFGGIPFGLAASGATWTPPALVVYGGEGDDTVDFGKLKGGTTTFYGGTEVGGGVGIDTADFSLRTAALGTRGSPFTIGGAASGESGELVTLSSDVEVIKGGSANDVLSCDAVLACTLQGNAGDDILIGGAGNDTISGGAGNDFLEPGAGNDTITGGTGIDMLSYWDGVAARAANGVTVVLPALGASPSTNNGDQVTNENDSIANDIEGVWGSAGDDTITGNDADNILSGAAGVDTLNGGAGNDLFLMGTDLDLKDTINGGSGEDTVDFSDGASLPATTTAAWTTNFASGWTGDIFITLNGASASAVCGPAASGGTAADYCQVTNVENVIGGSGVNTITGDANDNRLEGGVGDDVIVGGGGNDILAPGLGTNTVTCGASGNSILISLPTAVDTDTTGLCH